MRQTLAEKLLSLSAGRELSAGQTASCNVDMAMIHEAGAQMLAPLKAMGVRRVWDPDKVMAVIDHWAPASSEKAAMMHAKVREVVTSYGIKHFYDLGRHGICHQLLAEEGFIKPGDLVVGTDSHTTMGGALGSFATGIGPTEMAAVFAIGEIWLRVPESIRITIEGGLPEGVYGKDLILATLKQISVGGGIYKALEFVGETVKGLAVPDRLTLCNMAVEMGGKAGLVAPDDLTYDYLSSTRFGERAERIEIFGDENARYAKEVHIDASQLEPQVAIPHSPDNVHPISEVDAVRVDQAFVGSCTNGRIEDLREAARVLAGRTVAQGTRLIVTPASQGIYRQAMAEGLVDIFMDAGALFTPSGCGACFGGHMGVLAPGEVCISSSNRNFVGRMGSAKAKIYLASPATVAASAVEGKISDPRNLTFLEKTPRASGAQKMVVFR